MNAQYPLINLNRQEPLRVIVTMEKDKPESPEEDSRIKKVAAYFLIAIGLLLVAGAFCLFGGHVMGGLVIETMTIHTLFICGLYAAIGGFSLQNANYKGSLTLAHPGIPFSFKAEQK